MRNLKVVYEAALKDREQKAKIYLLAQKKQDRKIALNDWQAAVQECFRLEDQIRKSR